MDNPIVYQALGGLAALFFLVAIYFLTKTWRWLHVTLIFFVFCASIAFCVYASMVYRTHHAWRSQARDNRIQFEEVELQHETLLHGDLTEVTQTQQPLQTKRSIFARFVQDRGRVWRKCTPQAPGADDTVVVATGAADGPPNRLEANTVLYAFREELPDPALGLLPDVLVPVMYLGEFNAAAVTDASVTLTPTIPLDANQKRLLRQNDTTWALYEAMPVDGYSYFTEPGKPDLTLSADDEPVFGTVNEASLRSLLERANSFLGGEMGEEFDAMLTRYLRNGKRGDENTDAPENLWQKVRFIEDYEEPLIDSDAKLGALDASPYFFDRGRAEVPLLRRDGPAKLKKESISVFPTEDAERLADQNYVEIIEPIYVRPLNHYDFIFRNTFYRTEQLEVEAERLRGHIQENEASNRRTLDQITFRTEEKTKLEEDLDKFNYELEQIQAYQAKLQKAVTDTNAELSRLYRTNYLLAEELARMQDEMTKDINRRTAEAVSAR